MGEIQVFSVFIGLFVGLMLALTGAGGAILSIPLLVFFCHLSVSEAAPIGLLALMLSAGASSFFSLKLGIVRYKAAGLMAILGIMSAPFGVWLSLHTPLQILNIIFALILIYISIKMWRNSSNSQETILPAACQLNPVTSKLFWTASCTQRLSVTGLLAGLFSGLLGVGGGFVIVPALRKVTNLDHHTIIATSLAVIALVSTSGFVAYVVHQPINWPLAIYFSLSTIAGILIGRQWLIRIPADITRQTFAALAFLVAIGMLVKTFA